MIAAHVLQRPEIPRYHQHTLLPSDYPSVPYAVRRLIDERAGLTAGQRAMIALLAVCGGATAADVAASLGLSHKDACHRLKRLRARGIVTAAGRKAAGKRGGRPAVVWRVVT